eukprot:TRINITY_DN24663_c0_g1_i1.p1 TRINITY_DN24663_c0_g1~~TRINITY_DN24663_c0_g1_i1.p1  ORF type:complete len:177 (-),score=15.96 TRINITY_DN24663_c0_g1_i1:516-1046(-)
MHEFPFSFPSSSWCQLVHLQDVLLGQDGVCALETIMFGGLLQLGVRQSFSDAKSSDGYALVLYLATSWHTSLRRSVPMALWFAWYQHTASALVASLLTMCMLILVLRSFHVGRNAREDLQLFVNDQASAEWRIGSNVGELIEVVEVPPPVVLFEGVEANVGHKRGSYRGGQLGGDE